MGDVDMYLFVMDSVAFVVASFLFLYSLGATGCKKGFVTCFLTFPLPALPVELSENILQNLLHNLPPQTVCNDISH